MLLGQCIRSNAGLYYENAGDFAAALDRLLDDAGLADAMGRNGRQYFAQHYSWPVIERKYLEMFDRLASAPAGTPDGAAARLVRPPSSHGPGGARRAGELAVRPCP